MSIAALNDGSIAGETESELLVEARRAVPTVPARTLDQNPPDVTIFVDTSQEFARRSCSRFPVGPTRVARVADH